MQFYKFGSTTKKVYCNINKYRIDWDGKSASKLQFKVKQFLKVYWSNHLVLEETVIPGSLLRIDFLDLTSKTCIEVNGSQHGQFNKWFHKNRVGYWKSLRRDVRKIEWLEQNGFTVAEIEEEDIGNLSAELLEEKYKIIL